jgi:hypothetical protein
MSMDSSRILALTSSPLNASLADTLHIAINTLCPQYVCVCVCVCDIRMYT